MEAPKQGAYMEVPILKQGAYLIATVQSALTDGDLLQLRDRLVQSVSRHRARAVILDLTALDKPRVRRQRCGCGGCVPFDEDRERPTGCDR